MFSAEPTNDKYRTLFNARSEQHSRSLQNIGKASLGDARPQDGSTPAGLPSGMDSIALKKMAYARELQQQIEAKQSQKINNLQHDRKSDWDMLKQAHDNDPFGKQGSGAPIRDHFGNIITTRKKDPYHHYHPGYASRSVDEFPREMLYNNPNNIDPYRVQSKPHNPYVNHLQDQLAPPDFAIKAQLLRENMHQINSSYQQAMGMAQPQQQYQQQQQYFEPSQHQMQAIEQESRQIQVPQINSSASMQLPSPVLQSEGMSAFPQGAGGGNGELQRDLLMQIEDKKRREELDKREKKLQDLIDEERIRRENEEFNRIHGVKTDKLAAKNLHLSIATGPEKKNRNTTNTVEHSLQQTKSSLGDLRVVEELSGRPKIEIEQKIIKEIPIEVEKQVQKVVDEELRQLRAHFAHEQQGIGHELLNLKHQSVTANKERDEAQREIEQLKFRLKDHQLRDAIRQEELYHALVRNNDKPVIIKTNTRIEDDTEQTKFDFPERKGRRPFWAENEEWNERALDEFDPHSKMISITRGLLDQELRPNSREFDFSDTNDALNRFKYFDTDNDNDTGTRGIQVADLIGKYNLPGDSDDFNRLTSLPFPDDITQDGVVGILRKNNDRLNQLEGMEHEQIHKFDKARRGRDEVKFRYDPDNYDFNDELVQEVNDRYGDDYTDVLIRKINNPRAYM